VKSSEEKKNSERKQVFSSFCQEKRANRKKKNSIFGKDES